MRELLYGSAENFRLKREQINRWANIVLGANKPNPEMTFSGVTGRLPIARRFEPFLDLGFGVAILYFDHVLRESLSDIASLTGGKRVKSESFSETARYWHKLFLEIEKASKRGMHTDLV